MRFLGVECDQCKKQERWEKENTLPPRWSTLTWYEQAKTAADTIAETATFCSDACHIAFVRKKGTDYFLWKQVYGFRFKDGEERVEDGKYTFFLCDDGVQDESDGSCCLHEWSEIAEIFVSRREP